MFFLYSLVLFLITLAGGSMPLWNRGWNEQRMKYLLAFSGAFLLCITLLHLVPETLAHEQAGHTGGLLIVAGFFLQQMIQRITHGVEHGHVHSGGDHHHHVPVLPVFAGLAVHAFSEGLPLGITYADTATQRSLFLAIAFHKLPEAMLITSLVYFSTHNRTKATIALVIFALITPLAATLTALLGARFQIVGTIVQWCIPVIAGAFIHIATTILFESGTRSHEMNWKKWTAMLSGIGLAVLTLLDGHAG
ncbi:ZIP family metal transporter [Taibaiella koreensis]|uniref:ZIP family metal transporter n=1 Tax=Taibaiella koreensis TaxID=1268548 RepID=UPI000E59A500|nr:ZIP family metal transporter [Taibaiella koreensis]